MDQTLKPVMDLNVFDLVVDPFTYGEALIGPVRDGCLEHDESEHLAAVLPVAIAQLDAVGDVYRAMALAGVFEQLEHHVPA